MTDPFILPRHCWLKQTAAFSSASSALPCNWATAFFSPDLVFLRRNQPLHKLEGHAKVPPCLMEARSVFVRNVKCFLSHLSKSYNMFVKKQSLCTQHIHPSWAGCVWPFVQKSKSPLVRIWVWNQLIIFFCGLFYYVLSVLDLIKKQQQKQQQHNQNWTIFIFGIWFLPSQ